MVAEIVEEGLLDEELVLVVRHDGIDSVFAEGGDLQLFRLKFVLPGIENFLLCGKKARLYWKTFFTRIRLTNDTSLIEFKSRFKHPRHPWKLSLTMQWRTFISRLSSTERTLNL